MLAARCPGCGAACPVSVHEAETLRCDQCGHTGPHAEEVRAGLQEAARVLGEAADYARQGQVAAINWREGGGTQVAQQAKE